MHIFFSFCFFFFFFFFYFFLFFFFFIFLVKKWNASNNWHTKHKNKIKILLSIHPQQRSHLIIASNFIQKKITNFSFLQFSIFVHFSVLLIVFRLAIHCLCSLRVGRKFSHHKINKLNVHNKNIQIK